MKMNGIMKVVPEYFLLFMLMGLWRWWEGEGVVLPEPVLKQYPVATLGDAARVVSSQRLTQAGVATPRRRAPVASPGCGMGRNRSPITSIT